MSSRAKLSLQPTKWLTGVGKLQTCQNCWNLSRLFNLTDHACRNGTYVVHCPNRPAIWCIHLDFPVPPGLGHPKQNIAVSATSTCRSILSVHVILQQFGGAGNLLQKLVLGFIEKDTEEKSRKYELQYTAMPDRDLCGHRSHICRPSSQYRTAERTATSKLCLTSRHCLFHPLSPTWTEISSFQCASCMILYSTRESWELKGLEQKPSQSKVDLYLQTANESHQLKLLCICSVFQNLLP